MATNPLSAKLAKLPPIFAAVETKAELFLRMFTLAVALLNYVTRLITPERETRLELILSLLHLVKHIIIT